MSRAYFWQYVLNSEGQPVEGAIIRLYKEPELSAVTLYDNMTGVDTSGYKNTDENGFFDFWIGDPMELHGHNANSTFSMSISGSSITPITLTNISFRYPSPRLLEVDTSTNWVPLSGDAYTYELTHNFNTYYPILGVYDVLTKSSISFTYMATTLNHGIVIVDISGYDPNASGVYITAIGKDTA